MHTQDNASRQRQTDQLENDLYHSVEFALDSPYPVYQFKLWRSEHNQLFLLVKDNSSLLPRLKVGHILPMRYFSDMTRGHMKVCKTIINNIVNERAGRFKGHHRIDLAPVQTEFVETVQ